MEWKKSNNPVKKNKHKPAENTTQDNFSTIDDSPNRFQTLQNNPEDPYFDDYTHLLPNPISKNTTTPLPLPPQTKSLLEEITATSSPIHKNVKERKAKRQRETKQHKKQTKKKNSNKTPPTTTQLGTSPITCVDEEKAINKIPTEKDYQSGFTLGGTNEEIEKIRKASAIPPDDDSDDNLNLTQMIEKAEIVIHGKENQNEMDQKKGQCLEPITDDKTEKEEGEIVEEKPDEPAKGIPAAHKA